MSHAFRILPVLFLLLLLGGCIQSEETRTFYLTGDGKVDLVIFYDNVRSGDPGEKGVAEERKWLGEFKGGKSSEQASLRKVKAANVRSLVLRDQVPYSAVIRATLATADQLGKFLDLNKPGGSGTLRFAQEGKTRRLVFHVAEEKDAAKKKPAADPEKQSDTTYPTWRFIPVRGKLADGKVCVPAPDHLSCTLDFHEIERLDRDSGKLDFEIAWTEP